MHASAQVITTLGDTPKGEFFGVFRVSPSGQTEQWNRTIYPESIHGWMAVEVGDVPFQTCPPK